MLMPLMPVCESDEIPRTVRRYVWRDGKVLCLNPPKFYAGRNGCEYIRCYTDEGMPAGTAIVMSASGICRAANSRRMGVCVNLQQTEPAESIASQHDPMGRPWQRDPSNRSMYELAIPMAGVRGQEGAEGVQGLQGTFEFNELPACMPEERRMAARVLHPRPSRGGRPAISERLVQHMFQCESESAVSEPAKPLKERTDEELEDLDEFMKDLNLVLEDE